MKPNPPPQRSRARQVKAQLRWSPTSPPFDIAFVSYPSRKKGAVHPHWTVYADAESYDAMVEQMANAINGPYLKWRGKGIYGDTAAAALRAIGITRTPTRALSPDSLKSTARKGKKL